MNVLNVVLEPVRYWLDRRRFQRNLRDLPEWDAAHDDPESGVWRLAPPCGYETWKLHGPGGITIRPTAEFDATAGPGFEDLDDVNGFQRLPEIEVWAAPWIEQVSGGRVVEMVEGWTIYGPARELREYAVFARVEVRR